MRDTSWQTYSAYWAESGLHVIGESLRNKKLRSDFGVDEYVCDQFAWREYCWCDMDEHPNGCPPNFEVPSTGLIITWYKHPGRSVQSNMLQPNNWFKIVADCLLAIEWRSE